MTCASCALRVERSLNAVAGVRATVNYATARASVDFEPDLVAADGLLAAVASAGYRARFPDELAPPGPAGGRRLAIVVVLAAPVVAVSMVHRLQFAGWETLATALAAVVVGWGGLPIHRATWRHLRRGVSTMDTLISIGTIAALSWSVVAVANDGPVFVEVAAGVVAAILFGRWLEDRGRHHAADALRALATLAARDATVVRDGSECLVAADEVAVGDLLIVRPGERIAADGTIVEGTSAIDSSLLTGESTPIDVGPGDDVAGGTVSVGGRLVVRALRVGSDTALARVAALVERAQAGKAPVQRLADRVAAVFVPIVIALAAVTLVTHLVVGSSGTTAFAAAVAVLIVACPCALGLATPLALLAGTGRGAQLGILIHGPAVLESTRRVDTVVLDKTGTVTTGRMTLVSVTGPPEVVRLAAAVERGSEHPVGRAIAAAVPAAPPVDRFVALAGLGAEGVVEGQVVVVGRPSLLESRGIALPDDLAAARRTQEELGRTAVAVAVDGVAVAVLAVADEVRSTSAGAITALRALGLRPLLLTGDNRTTAAAVADAIGLDEVISEVLPADKVRVITRLQAEGRVVAMVGDGINDAPALATADLGIAMGSGSDIAIATADLTLVGSNPATVATAIRLARKTLGTIRGNLFWAFAYNVAALPIAAAGLLEPMTAGLAMVASSLFVVANSLRLRRFRA